MFRADIAEFFNLPAIIRACSSAPHIVGRVLVAIGLVGRGLGGPVGSEGGLLRSARCPRSLATRGGKVDQGFTPGPGTLPKEAPSESVQGPRMIENTMVQEAAQAPESSPVEAPGRVYTRAGVRPAGSF